MRTTTKLLGLLVLAGSCCTCRGLVAQEKLNYSDIVQRLYDLERLAVIP